MIGCGTSWFMAAAYAALREAAGQGATDAFPASELPPGRSLRPRRGDLALRHDDRGGPRDGGDALAGRWRSPPSPAPRWPTAATDTVLLDFADEQSVVQTVFATTTLMLLRASLGEPVEPVVAQAREVLAGRHAVDPSPDAVEQISFLGPALGLRRSPRRPR